MSDTDLQAMGADFLQALHARIATMSEGSVKARCERNASIAHRALENIEEIAMDQGFVVTPMSGGGPK